MENKNRLIYANALKDRFKLRIDWLEKDKHDEYTTGIWDGCLYDAKLIDEAPAVDAVEVVRCKECAAYCPVDIAKFYHAGRYCTRTGFITKEEDFCSYGEKRGRE